MAGGGRRISVVMPLYNKAAYVEEAVRSVLAQQPPPAELIVVDDGSTDDGAARVRAIDHPALIVRSQANQGVSAARNLGIGLASGELVAFLDADDTYAPGFLAAIDALAGRFPDAALLCTTYARCWPDGRRLGEHLAGAAEGEAVLIRDFYASWRRGAFTCASAIAVPRLLFTDPSLRFPAGERLGEDQDLWFRLAERGPVACLNRPLVDYRMDVAQSATQGPPVLDPLPCYRRLGERLAASAVPAPLRHGARRLLATHLVNVAEARLRHGDVAGARALLGDRRALASPLRLARAAWRLGRSGLMRGSA